MLLTVVTFLPALGALLVFFSDALPRHLSGPPERHPFQVLSPILASVFSGAFEPPF